MSKLTIGITGTRTYENKIKIKNFIHKLKEHYDGEIVIVGMGDLYGADRHIKKYALELGYTYKEMNAPHTPKNLYSLMTEAYYDRPYTNRAHHQRTKIYSQYVEKCVIFDDSDTTDTKVNNLLKELKRAKKQSVIITT